MARSLHRVKERRGYMEIFVALVLVRFVLLAIMLIFLTPNQIEAKKSELEERNALRIEVTWEAKQVDVDVWALAPGDRPVGWSNKGGRYLDLVRDDLGFAQAMHYEIIYGRALQNGEYIVNLHLYGNREPDYKIVPVQVDIYVIDLNNKTAQGAKIHTADVKLTQTGQELTVVRFNVVGGIVDPGSFNTIPRKLYGANQ